MPSNDAIQDQGSGTPVVLLHSSMSSKAQWQKLSAGLQGDFRVIAIDLYGYGAAERPPHPETFSLAEEAERIAGLIEQTIGQQPFHLVGHSYGAATALRYTYANQARLLTLGIYEPVAFHLLPPEAPGLKIIQEVVAEIDNRLSLGVKDAATAHFIDFWSGKGTFARLPREQQMLMTEYIDKVVLDFQALTNEPLGANDYSRLALPVCLLCSEESPLPTRNVAAILQQTLPNLETHWVVGGHMAPVTRADEVNPHWIDFIQRHQA